MFETLLWEKPILLGIESKNSTMLEVCQNFLVGTKIWLCSWNEQLRGKLYCFIGKTCEEILPLPNVTNVNNKNKFGVQFNSQLSRFDHCVWSCSPLYLVHWNLKYPHTLIYANAPRAQLWIVSLLWNLLSFTTYLSIVQYSM